MKKILICLAVITCCGCSPTGQNIKNTEIVFTKVANVGHFKYVEYDGHEYLIFSGGYAGGITHSPKCPCQNNK